MFEIKNYEAGIDIMSLDIGRIIIVDDETRDDVSQLQRQRGSYLLAHDIVMCNIESMSYDITQVFSESLGKLVYHSDPTYTDVAPNSAIFSSMLNLFSLMDQCAVFANNVLGANDSPEDAVFFGKGSETTAKSIANKFSGQEAANCLEAFGYAARVFDGNGMIQHAVEEEWHNILTLLRGRIVHRQAILFSSDLKRISVFIVKSGYRKGERDVYIYHHGGAEVYCFDFMCFLVFACEKLTSLIKLCKRLKDNVNGTSA